MLKVLFHLETDLYCGASWFSKRSVIPLYHLSHLWSPLVSKLAKTCIMNKAAAEEIMFHYT